MDRKKIIFKNVSLGVLYKIVNMVIVFTSIPLILNYLEKEQYGIWVTLFSLLNIVLFVDAGIGNGLKTKLSEALSLKNFTKAKTYITTAYISITVISIVLFLIGSVLIFNFNLQKVFNTTVLTNGELEIIVFTTLTLIIIGFILNLFKSLYYANQEASKVELAMLIYQGLILSSIIILLNFFTRDLFYVALTYGISNILVSLFFTILFFKKNKKIKPELSYFKKEEINNILGLSISFFIIQLCMIIIFTTDNLIITNLLGPIEVTNYDLVYRLFQIVVTFSVLLLDPFWALFTDAFQKKDFKWIKQTIIRFNKIFILLIVFIIGLFFNAESLIKLWIQREITISKSLVFLMSLFVLIRVYGVIYMVFLNAIGKVKLQMYLYLIGALINIPLSIYFVKYTNLGNSGVILGTILSILLMSIILPIQTFSLLKKKENYA